MSRRLLAAITVLAGLVLAGGAVPGLTYDNGTVVLSITAQALPTPCLTVTPATTDFGSAPHPFSSADHNVDAFSIDHPRLTNCGNAVENVAAVGTDATGPAGSWALFTLANATGTICTAGPNVYGLYNTGSAAISDVETSFQAITKNPANLTATSGGAAIWNAGQTAIIPFKVTMPCQGSNGAGETKTFSVTFTAAVV
jgi:hypothetical protein